MELEVVDKLFLELSQITTAKTKKEIELENLSNELIDILSNLHSAINHENSTEGLEKTYIDYYDRIDELLHTTQYQL